MKRIIGILAVSCMAITAAADHGAGYYGGQASYRQDTSRYSLGQGGEFRLEHNTESGGPGILLSTAAYASVAKNQAPNDFLRMGSFQTFCVEIGENLTEPMRLWVSTENAAGTGPGSHAWNGGVNTNDGDDLDPRTAYLYYRFATGTLPGYNYTHGSGTRSRSAGTLQRVFWYIEQEGGAADFSGTVAGIDLSPAEEAQAIAWLSLATARQDGLKGVRIIQTYALSGNRAQDLLYLTVPVPGAALLGVLGLGIAGWVKRRMA